MECQKLVDQIRIFRNILKCKVRIEQRWNSYQTKSLSLSSYEVAIPPYTGGWWRFRRLDELAVRVDMLHWRANKWAYCNATHAPHRLDCVTLRNPVLSSNITTVQQPFGHRCKVLWRNFHKQTANADLAMQQEMLLCSSSGSFWTHRQEIMSGRGEKKSRK